MVVVGDVIPVCISSGCTRQTVPDALSEWRRAVKAGDWGFVVCIKHLFSSVTFWLWYCLPPAPGSCYPSLASLSLRGGFFNYSFPLQAASFCT